MRTHIAVAWAVLVVSCGGDARRSIPDRDAGSDVPSPGFQDAGAPADAAGPEETPPLPDLPAADPAPEDAPPALSLAGVWPGRGIASGGETVTVTGEGFVAGLTVVFDQTPSPAVVVVDPHTASVVTPPHPPATVAVSVLRPDGASAVLEGAFTYANRTVVTGVEPVHISLRGGTPIAVSGAGFAGGAEVLVDGRRCPVVAVVDDARLLAVTPEGEQPGPADLIVASQTGQDTLLGGLIYDEEPFQTDPDLGITTVSPPSGPATGGTPIEVRGAGFQEGAEVLVGGLPATGVTVVAVDLVRAETPPGSPGPATVVVRQAAGAEAALIAGFEYEAPTTLLAIHPDQGATTGGTLVSLYGAGFPPEARVFFGEREASHVVVESRTRITCRTPPGPAGAVDVRLLAGGQVHTLPGVFTYFDPTGLYGGTWGGPVQGTLNVTVLDASAGGPLADAFVIVGSDPATPYQGYTGPDGVVTFSGPDLHGPLMVSASKDCYHDSSIVAFDAQNVTLYLQYVCPTPGGFPPGVAPGRISGRVLGLGKYVLPPPGNCWLLGVGEDGVSCLPCWSEADCESLGASCVTIGETGTFCALPCLTSEDCLEGYTCVQVTPGSAHCIPQPGRKTAICKTTQPDIFTEAPDPGKQSEVDADLAYSILVRPGDLAVVCLGGFRDAVTDEFKPYAMGVRRHVHVNPGDEIAGMDILLDIPMDRRFRVFLDGPPSGPEGPDFNYVIPYYDFQSDGVFADTWSVPFAFGDPQVVVEMQPRAFVGDLADVTYTFLAGAFSLTADNTPFSVALHQEVADLQDDTMFRLDGSTASVVRTGVRRDVFGMWGTAADAFFAVGEDGKVLHHDGMGFSLQPVEGATGATLRAVHGAGKSFALAVGDDGEVLRFDGVGWRREEVPIAAGRWLTGVACNAPDDCFAVGYGFAMRWDGASWGLVPGVPPGDLRGVAAIGHRQAVAVGFGGQAVRLEAAGATAEATGTTATLRAVAADASGGLWAVGDGGALVRWSGGSWKVLASGTTEDLYAVVARGDSAVAAGDAGTLVLAGAGGGSTVLKVAGYAPHLRAAFAAPGGPVFAMGVSQLLLGPFLPVPRVVHPPDGGLLAEPYIEIAADPGIPASMHYLLVAIPSLFGDVPVWEFIASGDTFRVDLPDFENLEGTPGIPRGTLLTLTVIRSRIPGFTMDHFDFSDLSPFEQSAWSVDITTFTRP